ncbi:MAG: CPBP family intramembrane glutamic endopeptidase [Marinobacter sp.]|nr:CPBP family intramembrane glutamic endopeptidase [Marinobacter sp.]
MAHSAANPTDTLKLALVIELVTFVVAVVGLSFVDVTVTWKGSGIAGALAYGLMGALLSLVAILGLTRSQTPVGKGLRDIFGSLYPFFRGFSWPQIVITALAAGFCEELFFRGFLQGWLEGISTPAMAVLVTSVVFGLLHYASFTYFVIATGIGLSLGLVYWLSESLLLVITWHGVYDLVAIAALAKYPRWLGLLAPEESAS